MEEFLLCNQLCEDYAEAFKAPLAPNKNACSVQELGMLVSCIWRRRSLTSDVGRSEAYLESTASDAAIACAEADQESSAILRPEMAAM